MKYLLLALAIVSEVVATSALKASEGFTRWGATSVVIVGYGCAFYLLSLCLERMKVGLVYAIWSGAGVALVSLAGWLLYRQRIDLAGWFGLGLIVLGVSILVAFSDMDVN